MFKDHLDKPSNDKQKHWNKRKNILGDGVTNSNTIQMIVVAKPLPPQTYINPPQQTYVNPSPQVHASIPPYTYQNPQQQAQHAQTNWTNAIIVS